MEIWNILLACGVPSAVVGLAIWYLQKTIEKNEKKRDEREKHLESLVLMMLQSTRANSILGKATAEAIRDGHCNGNVSHALEVVDRAAEVEKQFLLENSIKYIFE